MFRVLLAIVCSVLLSVPALSAEPGLNLKPKICPVVTKEFDVSSYLQAISSTVQSAASEGSQTLVLCSDGYVYGITCAHVVRHNRVIREVLDKTGGKKMSVMFKPVTVVKIGDEMAGERFTCTADIIRYSDARFGEDIAILRLRSRNYQPSELVTFDLGDKPVKLGTALMHCGSYLGTEGSDTLAPGIMSKHGRVWADKIYDQTNCPSFPGSSGGAVVTEKDGKYVGMVSSGSGETFTLMVPTRRMYIWAKKVGVGFIFDGSKPPSEKDLLAGAVEEESIIGTIVNGVAVPVRDYEPSDKAYKFLDLPKKETKDGKSNSP